MPEKNNACMYRRALFSMTKRRSACPYFCAANHNASSVVITGSKPEAGCNSTSVFRVLRLTRKSGRASLRPLAIVQCNMP